MRAISPLVNSGYRTLSLRIEGARSLLLGIAWRARLRRLGRDTLRRDRKGVVERNKPSGGAGCTLHKVFLLSGIGHVDEDRGSLAHDFITSKPISAKCGVVALVAQTCAVGDAALTPRPTEIIVAHFAVLCNA